MDHKISQDNFEKYHKFYWTKLKARDYGEEGTRQLIKNFDEKYQPQVIVSTSKTNAQKINHKGQQSEVKRKKNFKKVEIIYGSIDSPIISITKIIS